MEAAGRGLTGSGNELDWIVKASGGIIAVERRSKAMAMDGNGAGGGERAPTGGGNVLWLEQAERQSKAKHSHRSMDCPLDAKYR